MNNTYRNAKQHHFLSSVYNNTADYQKPGKGGYQIGITAFKNAGRASGKTFVMLDMVAISAFELPRALAGLGSKTFKQVMEIVLGQMSTVFPQYGLSEYDAKTNPWGNYVVFKEPPSHWPKCYNSPKKYDNCISFATGYTLLCMSADRPDTQRGINLDQYFSDETSFTKQSFYTDIVRAGIRANKYKYADARPGRSGHNHPLHWSNMHFSSAPRTMEGSWIYTFEENAKADPEKYIWIESTAYDNIDNLPGDYIESMKRDMTPVAFEIEVMNRRPKRAEQAFYPAFSSTKHCYTFYSYEQDPKTGLYKLIAGDYDTWKPLDVSFDFNANFTSCIISQDYGKEIRIIDQIWVKESAEGTFPLPEIVRKFIEKYEHHLKKIASIYGDSSGKNKDAARDTHYNEIMGALRKAGWKVIDEVDNNVAQSLRYQVVNKVLEESAENAPRIRINEDKCADLIYSVQFAETDKKGEFRKNKDSEKKKSIPGERATHLSDCFDYLIYRKCKNLVSIGRSSGASMMRLRTG